MSDVRIGVIGGSGLYEMAGLDGGGGAAHRDALGRAFGRLHSGRPRRSQGGLPGPPRPRASPAADGAQLPRQRLRLQDSRRRVPDLGLGGRIAQEGVRSRAHRRSGPVLRPHASPARHLLRQRHRGARLAGASGLAGSGGDSRRFRRRRRRRDPPRRLLRQHGGSAVLDPRRIDGLSPHGLRHHRHDQPPGGEARARGRDRLRLAVDGDRLRLLARGGRGGDRRGRDGGPAQERRAGAARRAAGHRRARAGGRQRLLERPGDGADHRPQPGPGRHPAGARAADRQVPRPLGGKLAWRR